MMNLKLKEQNGDVPEEPCDPDRLKVLEEAMREAIHAYLGYIDPANRITRDEALNHLIGVLDRREVAEAAKVDIFDEGERPSAEDALERRRAG